MKTCIKILLSLIFLFLNGCIGTYIIPPKGDVSNRYIPEIKQLKRIERLSYEEHNFNCKHKSILYHNYLRSKNIESRVVTGFVEGYGPHAWVEVYNSGNDKWYMIDPTWSGNRYDREGYEIESYKQRERWFIYKTNVTVGDIEGGNNFEKIIWENLPLPFKLHFVLKGDYCK